MNTLPPSSGLKGKMGNQAIRRQQPAVCLLSLLNDFEYGSNMFLSNVRKLPPDYMATHSRRQYSSQLLLQDLSFCFPDMNKRLVT
jgi:hypothetical protein